MTRLRRHAASLLPAALPLALLLAAPSLPASPAGPAAPDKITHRPRSLDEVVDRLAVDIPAQINTQKILVCWLLDSTRLTQQMEIHEKLASRIEKVFAAMDLTWRDRVFMAVCSMGDAGKPAGVVSPVSPDLSPAVKAIRDLGGAPDNTYKNVEDAIRRVTQAMATFVGRRILVVVTLENGDTEDNLEGTIEKLRGAAIALHIVSREAFYSDPWGDTRNAALHGAWRSYELEPPFALTGHDAPAAEYPIGWVFDRTGIHDAVPSGFGLYSLSRLAAATGGTYSILMPAETAGPPFCTEAGCALCEGTHTGCDAVYDPARLALVAPSLGPREAYRADLAKIGLGRSFFQAWQIAWDAGLCAMPPTWEGRGGSLNPPKGYRNARGPLHPRPAGANTPPEGTPWSGWDFDGVTHGGMGIASDWKVEDAIRECEKAIQTLEAGIRTGGLPEPGRRLVAAAETLLCQLHATRFNLNQFRHLRDEMKTSDSALSLPPGLGGFVRSSLSEIRRTPELKWRLDYRNIWFCHGGDRVADVTFLAGPQVRKEQTALVERVDRNIQKYKGTPWEVLSRRIGLVVLRPYPSPPPPPVDPQEAKPKPTRQPKEPQKPQGPPPPRPPFTPPSREPRTYRGSTLTTDAAAAGGDAATAEEKRVPTITPSKPPEPEK
jgi:hypothetical protein